MAVGFKARVLGFARRVRDGVNILEVTVDPGGGPNVTLEVMGSPGDDSPPLPTDYAFGVPSNGTGRGVAVGFADPLNEGEALGGERRFVGRDSDGKVVCTVWLKGDGSVAFGNDKAFVQVNSDGAIDARNGSGNLTLDSEGAVEARNAAGSVVLSAAGAVDVNAKTASIGNGVGSISLDVSGTWTINGVTITPTGDVISAAGKSLNLHTHPQADDSGGDTQQPTGLPL